MSLTCRIYLYLDERAARFERDAELAAEPADRMRSARIAAVFEKLTTVGYRVRLGRTDYRVRDLVAILWGDASEFEARAWDEIPSREGRDDSEVAW